MKNIYKSPTSGKLYAHSKEVGYIWHYGIVTKKWNKILRLGIKSSIFDSRNIYKGKVVNPPDWTTSLKDKIIKAF